MGFGGCGIVSPQFSFDQKFNLDQVNVSEHFLSEFNYQ